MDEIKDMIERAYNGNWAEAISNYKSGITKSYKYEYIKENLDKVEFAIFNEISFYVASHN